MTLAATWGTAVTPETTEGIRILTSGGSRNYSKPPYMSETSDQPEGNLTAVTSGLEASSKVIPFNLSFDDVRPFAYVLGNGSNYSTPAEQTGGQGDYLHSIIPADDIYGLFFTYAELHGSIVETWPSCKGMRFTITGEAGADLHVRGELEFFGYGLEYDNGVISSSNFTSLTYPTQTDVLFDQLLWRINDQSGDALDSADSVPIKSFTYTYKRVLATDLYDNVSAPNIIEPPNNGVAFDNAMLNVNFNYGNSTVKDFINDLDANTTKKFDLTFTGAQIGSGDNYTFKIECPAAKVVDPADSLQTGGSGLLPGSMTFNCVRPANATTNGMLFQNSMRMQVTNQVSAKQIS